VPIVVETLKVEKPSNAKSQGRLEYGAGTPFKVPEEMVPFIRGVTVGSVVHFQSYI